MTVARAGWWAGWIAVSTGVYLTFGLGWTLIVAGLVLSLSFLLLYDVEEEASGEPPATGPPPL